MHHKQRIEIRKEHYKYVFIVIGLVLLAYEGYAATRSIQAKSWKQTSGTVTEASMSHYGVGSRRSRTQYLKFEYRYRVDGKGYKGHHVGFGGFGQFFRVAGISFGTTLMKYERGQSTTVYYNPGNPHDAVLERELPLSAKLAFGLGVSLLIGGVMWAVSKGGQTTTSEIDPRKSDFQESFV